jgi:uncharacterized protein YyaL (SSP411 family)
MQRPATYPVLTFVACFLVVFLFIERGIHPYVPKGAANPLAKESADFLQQGGYEMIKWFRPDQKAFAKARSEEKPILMVIGAPWSAAGRRLDRDILSTERTQRLLDRNFICIRVDAEQQPDWAGAYLPVTRGVRGAIPDLQIYVLDSEGRLMSSLRNGQLADVPDENAFIAQISDALSAFDQYVRNAAAHDPSKPQTGLDQANDLSILFDNPPDSSPDLQGIWQSMRQSEQQYGGLAQRGSQPLWPQAWTFESAVDPSQVAQNSKETSSHLWSSPVTDPLDGGFYRGATNLEWTQIVFDKVATQNAEMALFCARLYLLTNDTFYLKLAERTFDYLLTPKESNGLLDATGFVLSCRIGDEQPPLQRSLRSSFSPRRLRDLFANGATEDLVGKAFGLTDATNPQRVPAMRDVANYRQLPTNLADALEKMQKSSTPQDTSGQITLTTQGIVAARLTETARLLNDPARAAKAAALVENIKLFRVAETKNGDQDGEVTHDLNDTTLLPPTLSDYLAYSDACLQEYLRLGRIPALMDGLKVLRRATGIFRTKRLGLFNQGTPTAEGHLSAPDSNVPGISDDSHESTEAMMIRLSWCYGELYRESPSAEERQFAAHLRSIAADAVAACAKAANTMGAFAGSYDFASALQTDSKAVFAVGVDPSSDAASLARRSPFRMIAPAIGPVRPDLQSRAKGFYISIHAATAGPFTEDEAFGFLRAHLNIIAIP